MILVVGSVAIDAIHTPNDFRKELMGGSAVFAALGATSLQTGEKIHLIGVVGKDYPQENIDLLEEKEIDLSGLERKQEEKSFAWTGKYAENLEDRQTLEVELKILETWKIQIPENLRSPHTIILANMSPQNQWEVLKQCDLSGVEVYADTMDLWIGAERPVLEKVLKKANYFFLNKSEAEQFSEKNEAKEQAAFLLEKMKPEGAVIIKQGSQGVNFFQGGKGEMKSFFCPANSIDLVDPTGAGDVFLGAFATKKASLGPLVSSDEAIIISLKFATVISGSVCEGFSAESLLNADSEIFRRRFKEIS